MSFICDINYTGSMAGPIDFNKAFLYLNSYMKENQLTRSELDVIVPLLQYKAVCCCFTLEKHYLNNDDRADIFYPKMSADWFWWLDYGQKFQEQVIDKIKAKYSII